MRPPSISSRSSSSGPSVGRRPAVATALLSFVIYDFLFTSPRFSLVVSDANELLNLVLVLFVALVVGRLAGARPGARRRGGPAGRRGDRTVRRESTARDRRPDRGGRRCRSSGGSPTEATVDRVWIGLERGRSRPGPRRHGLRTAAGARLGPHPRPDARTTSRLVGSARTTRRPHEAGRRSATDEQVFRIKVETEGTVYGSLWADAIPVAGRPRSGGDPIAVPGRRPDRARAAARPAPPGGDDAPRSRGGAMPSRAPCSTRSRTTCGRRSRASGRRPGISPTRPWTGRRTPSGRPPDPSMPRSNASIASCDPSWI